MSAAEPSIPVFISIQRAYSTGDGVQPQEIVVITSRPESYKQYITLINPYSFALLYRVLSDAPFKFGIYQPSGCVPPRCVAKITFLHLDPNAPDVVPNNVLRIEVRREGEPQACGRKDVRVNVVSTDLPRAINTGELRSFPAATGATAAATAAGVVEQRQRSRTSTSTSTPTAPSTAPSRPQPPKNQNHNPNNVFWCMMVLCIACIVAVMLPTHNPDRPSTSLIPPYFHPTQNLQFVAAFMLGMVTLYLFQLNN